MMPGSTDATPPPSDLDVLAARYAHRLFADAVAHGVPEGRAWAEAVAAFRDHHPSWPLPLAEREAARMVGALAVWQRGPVPPVPIPPLRLLLTLAAPQTAERMRAAARAAALGSGAEALFRGAWKLRPPSGLGPRMLPIRRLPLPAPEIAAAARGGSAGGPQRKTNGPNRD